jgi:hypothetical protein
VPALPAADAPTPPAAPGKRNDARRGNDDGEINELPVNDLIGYFFVFAGLVMSVSFKGAAQKTVDYQRQAFGVEFPFALLVARIGFLVCGLAFVAIGTLAIFKIVNFK